MKNPACQFLYDAAAAQANMVLHAHVMQSTMGVYPMRTARPLAVMKWGEDGMIGSACGTVYPGWLCIDLLWVEFAFRGGSVGKELLSELERKAGEFGAHSAYVWTQDFEAPEFYRKHGYQDFVQLQEFIPGHQMVGLQKKLA